MKRLVYSPKVEVFIKADSGVYDLSPYVESCSVARKVNQVSTATVKFRNPQFIWTNRKTVDTTGLSVLGPVFHPMDPITITMTRINNRPIQVFTGFCDSTPYLQLFPGTCTLTASCTLKRILHTYWDPGVPFVKTFLESHGWAASPNGISNPTADGNAQDSKTLVDAASIGGLLYDVLVEIGGWSEETIYIENLPTNIVDTVSKIYDQVKEDSKESQDELHSFLKRIIGTGSLGTALPEDNSGTVIPAYDGKTGKLTPLEAKSAAKSMLKDFGWDDSQWPDLEKLWEKESGWSWSSDNPDSDAYGIPQAMTSEHQLPADFTTNAISQITWGLNYIKNRYRTPKAAWVFQQANNWY